MRHGQDVRRACQAVSIHASRCREAMPASSKRPSTSRSFQSTPPVAGRRCVACSLISRRCHFVSIHASRCREAMLAAVELRHPHLQVSIHASRCREAMPAFAVRVARDGVFQSTPPVAGRRCRLTRFFISTTRGFNPRLPLPGGDAHEGRIHDRSPSRFNPRLPLPGGDALEPVKNQSDDLKFQSTPPLAGRRCRGSSRSAKPLRSFNPRLPLPGGDA